MAGAPVSGGCGAAENNQGDRLPPRISGGGGGQRHRSLRKPPNRGDTGGDAPRLRPAVSRGGLGLLAGPLGLQRYGLRCGPADAVYL